MDVHGHGRANLLGATLVEQDHQEVAGLDVKPSARVRLFAVGSERQVFEAEPFLAEPGGGGYRDDHSVAHGELEAMTLNEFELLLEVGAVRVRGEDDQDTGILELSEGVILRGAG